MHDIELQAALLEIEIRKLVADEFDLDARLARARKEHRPVKHLTHYRKLVKTVDLQRAAT